MSEITKLEDYWRTIEDCGFGFTSYTNFDKDDLKLIKTDITENALSQLNPIQILNGFLLQGNFHIKKPEVFFDLSNIEDEIFEQILLILNSISIIEIDETDGEILAFLDYLELTPGEYKIEGYKEIDEDTIWDDKIKSLEFLIPGFSISSKFTSKEQLNDYISNSLISVVCNCFNRSGITEKINNLLDLERN